MCWVQVTSPKGASPKKAANVNMTTAVEKDDKSDDDDAGGGLLGLGSYGSDDEE